jgi:hypothetical protein
LLNQKPFGTNILTFWAAISDEHSVGVREADNQSQIPSNIQTENAESNNESSEEHKSSLAADADSQRFIPDSSEKYDRETQAVTIKECQNDPAVEDNNNSVEPDLVNSHKSGSSNFIHILQKDAFLTFWALCKLAVKQTNMDETNGDISIM